MMLGIGFHLGEICCVAPTAVDDTALAASTLNALQTQVNTSVDYSIMENYPLQPAKRRSFEQS